MIRRFDDARALEQRIDSIAGVVTNGLFAARGADVLLLGTAERRDRIAATRERIARMPWQPERLNRYGRRSAFGALLRGVGWLVAALIVISATYVMAAIALGAIPVNSSFAESPEGVPIYLRTNGVHAELILPTRAGSIDWSVEHPPAHMRSLAEPLEWMAFGWGDRGFFAHTPTWADLKTGNCADGAQRTRSRRDARRVHRIAARVQGARGQRSARSNMRDWLRSSERRSSATRRAARIAPTCPAIFQPMRSTMPAAATSSGSRATTGCARR